MNPNNYSTISLFGLEMNPPRGFELFGMNIRFYGIVIAVGLLLAVIYGLKRSKQFGLKEDDILDGVLGIVPFAIICARLYYVAFSWSDFKDDPLSILYIWEGGLAIYGGVIGAILGVTVLCLIRKIRLGALLDLVALGFLIGQSMGRWGNFFNREAFGATTDVFCKMGLFNDVRQAYEYYHPTFLYESLWNLVGFLALHFLSKKRQYDGQIALGYVFWYGLGRTFIEGLRVDSLYIGSLRVSQLLAALSCFAAAVLLVVNCFRRHDKEKLYVNVVALREAEEEDEEDEDDEDYDEEDNESSDEEEETSDEEETEEASSEEPKEEKKTDIDEE